TPTRIRRGSLRFLPAIDSCSTRSAARSWRAHPRLRIELSRSAQLHRVGGFKAARGGTAADFGASPPPAVKARAIAAIPGRAIDAIPALSITNPAGPVVGVNPGAIVIRPPPAAAAAATDPAHALLQSKFARCRCEFGRRHGGCRHGGRGPKRGAGGETDRQSFHSGTLLVSPAGAQAGLLERAVLGPARQGPPPRPIERPGPSRRMGWPARSQAPRRRGLNRKECSRN